LQPSSINKYFFRINVLVVDHIKNVLVHMFKYYLRKKKMSFEEFIDEHMADIKYLRKTRNLYKEEVDKPVNNVIREREEMFARATDRHIWDSTGARPFHDITD
jgi:hypothetical protein